jgi:hypothetical protein
MSAWQDLVTAALMGTERAGFPPLSAARLPVPADAPAAAPDIPFPDYPVRDSPGSEDPAALLLDRAALEAVARRGGYLPGRAEPLPAAEADPAPAVGRAAARRLARMLGGEHSDLLAEWLAAAAARGRRVPAALLPALLERARRVVPADPALRRLAAEAGGSRAQWLAGLNPDWKFVTAYTLTGDDAWRLGRRGQRRGYLAALRARDPGAARDLIADGWAAAGPDDRVMFVKAMAGGLSLADEPLLEAALDDPSAFVRKMASDVLAGLPGSALGQRMAARAVGCLRLEHGTGGPRLTVILPVACDAAMRRDGAAPDAAPVIGRAGSALSNQAHLLVEVLARTPLRTWTAEFGRTAAQVLAVPSAGWAPVLFAGWSRAAMTQRDQAWMTALISQALTAGPPGAAVIAASLRPMVRRVDPGLGVSVINAARDAGLVPGFPDAIRVLRYRYEMLKELHVDDSAG